MAIQYEGGGFVRRGDYNWVTTMDLHMPDIDSEITERYGRQMLTGMLSMCGAEKGTSALEYDHYEENRIYPKVKATNGGAGTAGASVTFTIDTSAVLSVPENASPYGGTVSTDVTVPRVNDLILIKPASGVVSSQTYIRAIVTAVDASVPSFAATPLDSTESIPSIAAADEIVIYGNAHGEGSGQPEGRQTRLEKYQNNLQIFKETYEITNTEKNMVTWTEFKGKDGQMGRLYQLKGEADTYKVFKNAQELNLLIGKKLSNNAVSNSFATAGNPVALTEGLIPSILQRGNVSSYSAGTGWDKLKAESLVKTLDKNKGSKENMICPGIDLSIQLDNTLAAYKTAGGITYGNYEFSDDARVNFAFDKFAIAGYSFGKKIFETFNDLQSFGADGYGFVNEGIVIPMGETRDSKSGEKTPFLRLRYLANPETGERDRRSEVVDNFAITGKDTWSVRYKESLGLETFAMNKFAYILQG